MGSDCDARAIYQIPDFYCCLGGINWDLSAIKFINNIIKVSNEIFHFTDANTVAIVVAGVAMHMSAAFISMQTTSLCGGCGLATLYACILNANARAGLFVKHALECVRYRSGCMYREVYC